jgi:hypothetical protein
VELLFDLHLAMIPKLVTEIYAGEDRVTNARSDLKRTAA